MMTNVNGGSNGANEISATTGQGPAGGNRPSSPGAFGASAKPTREEQSAASALVAAARPERRYSFNMLVATALLAFAAGRICSR